VLAPSTLTGSGADYYGVRTFERTNLAERANTRKTWPSASQATAATTETLKMSSEETLFCLRYAVRVHERRAKLWSTINLVIRFTSLLSGSAAIGSITAANQTVALVFAAIFATMQAIEFSASPNEKSTVSKSTRKAYSTIIANKGRRTEAELDEAYNATIDSDEVIAGTTIKELAYNDVVREFGAAKEHLYAEGLRHKILSMLS
jgi:hypothetical protein